MCDQSKKEIVFNIGFLKLYRQTFFEQKLISTVYDLVSAEKYAKTQIEAQFEAARTHANERIVSIQILESEEKNNQYVIKALVQANKNIAKFQRVN